MRTTFKHISNAVDRSKNHGRWQAETELALNANLQLRQPFCLAGNKTFHSKIQLQCIMGIMVVFAEMIRLGFQAPLNCS